jgi:hypothetical protein
MGAGAVEEIHSSADPGPGAGASTYVGLFVITLATLMYEILLTRIFSVTMWYHFAFMAISIAMFGMTVGAMAVYVFPKLFTPERVVRQLGISALLFSLAVVLSFMTELSIPFMPDFSVMGVYTTALTYVVLAVPFAFSGVCVCLALTRFPGQVSQLYAADLAGAALGCYLIVPLLNSVDAPSAVVLVGLLAGTGALLFLAQAGRGKLRTIAGLNCLLLALFFIGNDVSFNRQSPWLGLTWIKGVRGSPPPYQKWNSFSYLGVEGDPSALRPPFGWGISPAYQSDRKVHELLLRIDAEAATPLTQYAGRTADLDYLRYDIINLAHYLRSDARVLVVGAGGGRDVLSALAFNQKAVTAVEINPDIVATVNDEFGDFTGHLDRDPRVRFVVDEARSYVTRSREQFDIIQVSFIDTWAASASGAFVLTENSLYTTEAWRLFLDHLGDDGVLSFSRWYHAQPAEVYRLTGLASAALMRSGVSDPRRHILIAKLARTRANSQPVGVGTILVKKTPFTEAELDGLEDWCRKARFEVVLSPRTAADEVFAQMASPDFRDYAEQYRTNIAPPTDDSPFFFNVLRLRDVFRPGRQKAGMEMNVEAVSILWLLLGIVTVLAALGIITPLVLTTKPANLRPNLALFVFFTGIGLGFMLIEISQLQRLIIFLGNPTYSLSVVLFSLLLSSGIGSATTGKISAADLASRGARRLLPLLGLMVLFGLSTPPLVRAFAASTTPVRIAVAGLTIFPMGLFMGMAFPLGMKLANLRAPDLTPWLWGVNGATSVCASVIAVAIALYAGITAAFWTGFISYALAAGAFFLRLRRD